MATEKLTAQIIVETDKKSLKQSEQEIERLRSPEAIKMAVDLWQLRQQLNVVKKALAESLKVWDSDLAKKLWGDLEILKKQITQANRELTNFVRTGDKEVSVLWKLFKQVWIDIENWVWKKLLQATEAISSFWSKALWLAGITAVWAWFYQLWWAVLNLADKLEQSTLSFTTMLWSATEAKNLLVDLSTFAKSTPFEIQWIRDTAKQLLAFWFSAEEIIPTLRSLGDVSAWLSVPIEQVAYAYGQVRSANQLYWTELRQFVNAWVPLLAQLAKQFNKTESEVKKMVEDGLVSFKDVEKAFQWMTQFAWLMEAQATTLSWRWSQLKDTFKILWEQIWTALLPLMKSLIAILQSLADFLSTTAWKAVAIWTAVWVLALAVVPLIWWLVGLAWAFTAASATWWILAWVLAFLWWPVTLIVWGLALLAWWAYYLTQRTDEASESTAKLSRRLEDLWNKSEELKNKQKELDDRYAMGEMTLAEYTSATEDLRNQMTANEEQTWLYKKALDILDDWNLTYIQRIEAINKLNLNPQLYNEIIDANKKAQQSILNTLKMQKELAMQARAADEKMIESLWWAATWEWMTMPKALWWKYFGEQLSELDKWIKEAEDMLKKWAEIIVKQNKTAWETTNKDDEKNKKKWTDIAKKAEEERKKIQKESIEFQKKVFENAKKLREDDIKNTEEYIAKLSKALQEINDIEKKIAWVESESWSKVLGEAWSRYRELLEWQKKLKEELIAAQNDAAWTATLPDPTIQKNIDETIKQIKELEYSGLLDQNTKAKEQQRASLTWEEQKRFDFQDRLWQIAIDKANEKARLEEEKTKIENDLKMKKDQIQKELLIAENRKASNEIAINKYKDMIALVEKGITDNTQKEIDKRMSLYAQEEQRLLRLIELRMQAWYAVGAIAAPPVSNTSNTTVNQVVNATVNNKVDQDALARDLANRVALANKWISK